IAVRLCLKPILQGMRGARLFAVFLMFSTAFVTRTHGQEAFDDPIGFNLNPPYFNLAAGSRISATATCGEDEAGTPRHDLYCKLVGGATTGVPTENIQGQYCSYCNSRDPSNAHPVSNAIDGTERWWQSPPLSRGLVHNEVNVTLDLGQLFHVAYILIKFANSPRPDLWVLERSVDHGRTFTPWQYFAHSKRECIERFGKQPNARISGDDDQICTTEYSRIVPLENGEIVVSLVNGRPGSKRFTYSPVLQDFTKATNIRLSFLRTNTLLGHLISKAQRDPTVTRRYFYSIKDISVGGRCVCHGHAQVCAGGGDQDRTNRLQCECQHNTCGELCDRCCPGYNQKPWRAATVDSPNECQPCQCFSHSSDCFYDPEVEKNRASLDTFGRYDGGGVCTNCQHNTAGVNCERCIQGFYRPFQVPPESPSGCIPCRCDERTTAGCEMGSGRCICKPQFSGHNCDVCADGYIYYPQCIRELRLVLSHRLHAFIFSGSDFEKSPQLTFLSHHAEPSPCPPGYFGSPSCQQCVCDYRGTEREVCDTSGRCLCRRGVAGERCDRCQPGHHSFPSCQGCVCGGAGVADSRCGPSGRCVCLPNYRGQSCEECAPGYYGYPECAGEWRSVRGAVGHTFPVGNAGSRLGWVYCGLFSRLRSKRPHCFPSSACQCSTEGSYGNVCNPVSGQCLCLPGVVGQQCDQCASGLRFPQCSIHGCNSAGSAVVDPLTGSCRCLENVEGTLCDRCKPLYWDLAVVNPEGCKECQCDLKGTLSGVGDCQQKSGQCRCKPNACGRSCNTCKDGYFQLQKKKYFGCQDCQCDVGGAVDVSCDETSGQCRCRDNVVGRQCSEPAPNYYFPTLHHLKFEMEDGVTPNSRPVRFGFNQREFPDFSWRGYAVMSPAQVRTASAPILPHTLLNLTIITFLPVFPLYAHVRARILLVDEAGFQSCCNWSDQSREVIFPESPSPSFLTVPGEGFAQPFELTPGKWIVHLRAEGILLDYLVLLPQDYYEAPLLREQITQPCTYSPTASRDSNLQLNLRVARPGPYVLILEYASEVDAAQNLNILINVASQPLCSATCSFLCRSVALDASNRVSVLCVCLALQYKVSAVPAEEFSMDYVEPKPLCVSTHGRFTEDRYLIWHLTLHAFSKTEITFTPQEPLRGRYVALMHYHQPEHASFPVDVRVAAGREWKGSLNASFCPAVSGCRKAVLTNGQTALDFDGDSWQAPSIAVTVPPNKTLVVDYILLVPEGSYTPKLLKEKLVDKSADFVQRCRSEGFHIDPKSASPFCRDSARSLAAAYNDGALPCNCHRSGSEGSSCDPAGGQCACRPHVIGRQCTKCASGYYGFPYCRPCECGRRLCDEVTGKCICPPQTVKPSCDVCQAQTFSYHPLLGCDGCECSPTGIDDATRPDCDRLTGQCKCPRISGRRCDRCAAGYYRFPECLPCNCNRDGVTPDVCHPDSGRCLCKKNVAGSKCDACKDGGFYFDPSNPHGCTSCFCFGATDQCRSSSLRRGKFVDMDGWRLESLDQEEVSSVLNPVSDTVVADVQELSPTVQTLHWVAPSSYLGNKVSSYGGFLTYQVKSFGIPSEGMTLMDRRPDVVLTVPNISTSPSHSTHHFHHHVEAHGHYCDPQGNWRHAINNRPVSREELMMVLADLVGLRINALYFTRSQRLSLGEVGLEETTRDGTGGPGNTVEQCSCPPQYTGDSCERCSPGYYREDSVPFPGRCVPCECNGHAEECEDKTGRCLNCRYNTAGDRCERCKEGYYGDGARGTCRVCPCPFSVSTNSFAVGCREVFGAFQCICRDGYTGDRCQSCAPGYFGDPLAPGGRCQPCQCNGNGNNCDPRTGVSIRIPSLKQLFCLKQTGLLCFLVLEYIKANVSRQYDENNETANKLQDLLKGYEAKLKDLDQALKDAKDLVKKANTQNGLNGQALADLQRRVQELKEERETVGGQMDMARNELKKTKELLDMLDDSKTEYERLAAQLDGAKTEVTKKVNEISKAAAKEDIVEAAEEHARNLSKLAKELEDIPTLNDKISEGHLSGCLLHPPKNLEDLKAYTSMSLSLQRPEGRGDGSRRRRRRQNQGSANMFVLYLGSRDNYLGMMVRNNVLYGVYKLDGQEYEMETGPIISSPSEPIDLTFFSPSYKYRIYQDAQMTLTKDITSGKSIPPIEGRKQGEGSKNLLDLSPSDVVFYVGGYPANFTPPASLNYPMYEGCIEFFSINDKAVSLYNFRAKDKINLQTPCKRWLDDTSRVPTPAAGSGRDEVRKNVVQLHVDTVDNYKIGPPSSAPALTKSSLYVGGIPEMLGRQTPPVTASFVGCIQDMSVNGEPVSFERPPAVFGPVNLKECPG
uniref:Laminin subunit alpha 3 n=1 Tax=Takifugu rubripes TaxID=31033 RepID=A0A674PDZ8_TAKRU